MDMNSHHINALELKMLLLFFLISILCFFFQLWRQFKICCMFEDRQDDQQSQNEIEIEMGELNRNHNYEEEVPILDENRSLRSKSLPIHYIYDLEH